MQSVEDVVVMRFREVQPFWRNRVAVVSTALVCVATGVSGALEGTVWPVLVGAGIGSTVLAARMVTTVSEDEAWVRFPPFRGRRLQPGDMVDVQADTYSPIGEFGGWGYRIGRGGARAYNVSGDRGVRIPLADGGQLVIGSQRPEELAEALRPLVRR